MNEFGPDIVVVAVIGLLVLIVVLQDTEAVSTKILFLTVTMPGRCITHSVEWQHLLWEGAKVLSSFGVVAAVLDRNGFERRCWIARDR